MNINSKLDLVFERTSKLSPAKLWTAWTDPSVLPKWFCPRPWKVTECRIDLRPGGEFFTLMRGPQNEAMPNPGCYLEVVPHSRLIFTNMMLNDFRPMEINPQGFSFVVSVTFAPSTSGTIYRAHVMHPTETSKIQHEKMGFQEGWGAAYQQLIEIMN